jgi:hypothetical protein
LANVIIGGTHWVKQHSLDNGIYLKNSSCYYFVYFGTFSLVSAEFHGVTQLASQEVKYSQ